ncbi:MAG: helix-turn-helix domain-containing protein [Sedimentisphaerales bacterium]|nr:helix-turn-helix domain-containing protein [Sedimentisphaerales bacterium]
MTIDNNSTLSPALLTIQQVCQLLNISHAEFYRLDASGKFAPLSIGLCRKRLYIKSEIESWIRAGCPHRKQWQIQKKEKL